MIKIGIDYSLISPAICVYKDGEYSFISFFDDYGKDWNGGKIKAFNYHRELNGFMEMNPYTRHIEKNDYREEQKTKMAAAKMIAHKISNRLVEIVGDEDVIIGLEGFSYGSISSSTLDLALFNSFLRIKLLEDFGEDCLVIISPTEGKKRLSGKGNAKKEDMIQAFIENRTKDPDIERCPFWKYCKENELDYKNIKPIDDLVDSYGILRSI
jgi:hypothetical protein